MKDLTLPTPALPPLPARFARLRTYCGAPRALMTPGEGVGTGYGESNVYTAEQMQDYARAALSSHPPCAAMGEVKGEAARLWIDTEFNEFRGELISIALVDEQGREFYEVLPPPLVGYGPWVAQHVVPILNKPAISLGELKAKLHAFLAAYGDSAHLVADWPEDIEHFLHLLIVGPGERIGPNRWTMEVRRDLPNTADTSHIPHNALEDAKALRACHLMMESAVALAAKGGA